MKILEMFNILTHILEIKHTCQETSVETGIHVGQTRQKPKSCRNNGTKLITEFYFTVSCFLCKLNKNQHD